MPKLDKEVTGRIELLVSKSKRELTAGIADEMNQPLQGIRGYMQEIEATGEITRETIQEIVRNVDRAAELINCMRAASTNPAHVCSVSEMTGHGYEYLVDGQGAVLAKFYNGQMIATSVPKGNLEVTRSAA